MGRQVTRTHTTEASQSPQNPSHQAQPTESQDREPRVSASPKGGQCWWTLESWKCPGSEVHRSESKVLRGESAVTIVRPGLACNQPFPHFVVPTVKGALCWGVVGASDSFPLSTEAGRAGKTHLPLHTLWLGVGVRNFPVEKSPQARQGA